MPNAIVGHNGAMPGVTKNPHGVGQASKRARATTSGASPAKRVSADDPLAAERVRYLADQFGSARLAAIIGVHRSQPTQWAKGAERPGPAAAPLLIDLEHVLARARLVWGDSAAHTWLSSPNAYLEGARPLDVLRESGPALILDALDAEAWGGAA